MIDIHPPLVGVFDLTVRFGNQTRTKCAACKHFMPQAQQDRATCRCGQIWQVLSDGRFKAMS